MEFNTTNLGISLAILVIARWLYKAFYNFYLHPLAKIPGPWWAAVSYLPEMYYDLIEGGRYWTVVVEMHKNYGPLVRLNPNELHFNDPQLYEQVYAGNMTKTNKDPYATGLTGLQTAVAVTLDHDHHRQRRGYYANFFSKKSTLGREEFIQEKVDKLMQRLEEAHRRRETITGITAFGALTTDVIAHYAYGESFDALDVPGLPSPLTRDMKCMLQTGHFRRFLPHVTNLMEKLPDRWLKWLSPTMGTFLDLNNRMEALSMAAREKSSTKLSSTTQKTIFDALMDPKIPAEEKTLLRLKDESTLILGAGLDTTSRFLTCAVCYLGSFPNVLSKLRAELKTFGNTQPTLTQLESLPYLTAFINETFRYQCSMSGHFPRVITQPLVYREHLIPRGTTIGARPLILNNDATIFPAPLEFRPERWIEAEASGVNLTKHLVTFSKGTRMCLGISLAYAEMYLTIATLVRKFEFELVDSGLEDIAVYRDYGFGYNEKYGFGVDFRITNILE